MYYSMTIKLTSESQYYQCLPVQWSPYISYTISDSLHECIQWRNALHLLQYIIVPNSEGAYFSPLFMDWSLTVKMKCTKCVGAQLNGGFHFMKLFLLNV